MNAVVLKKLQEELISELTVGTVVDLSGYSEEELSLLRDNSAHLSDAYRTHILRRIDDITKERLNKAKVSDYVSKKLNNKDIVNGDITILNRLILIDYDNISVDVNVIHRLSQFDNVLLISNSQAKINKVKDSRDWTDRLFAYKLVPNVPQSGDMYIQRLVIDTLDMYPNLDIFVISKDSDFSIFKNVNDIEFTVTSNIEDITDVVIPKILNLKSLPSMTRQNKRRHLLKLEQVGNLENLVFSNKVRLLKAEIEYYKEQMTILQDTIELMSSQSTIDTEDIVSTE